MLRRLVAAALVLTAATALALGSTPTAQAAWGSTGIGRAAQSATVMPAGATPTVTGVNLVPVGRTWTLTWPTAMVMNGQPVTGYTITRTSTSGGSVLTGGSCAGVALLGMPSVYVPANANSPTQSCTDTSLVTMGTVRYTITPVYGKWVGPSSTWSTPTT